jgi:protein-disulfide isomerase-like protein with CxxC motif
MNLSQLKTILEATGFPVAYSHFVESENNPLPAPPFIAYLVVGSSNFFADNRAHKVIKNIQIELYTEQKDLEAESKLETVLNENGLPFEFSETYIESEQLFQILYEVRLF